MIKSLHLIIFIIKEMSRVKVYKALKTLMKVFNNIKVYIAVLKSTLWL